MTAAKDDESAREIAAERQLEWLLQERLGPGPRTASAVAGARRRVLVAAVFLFALGAAFGVALLSRGGGESDVDTPRPAQGEVLPAPIVWHEAHGPGTVMAVPEDVINLRCFDFDDAALASLERLRKLERLDLSGMDVNAQGYSMAPPITDEGVRRLGSLRGLRWLSLAQCQAVKGTTLHALEALPRLEHLDLTHTCVESAGIERLARLPSLRELVLSFCTSFHGRSLAQVARLPGLRRLELRGCVTLAAADVAALASLHELRHLDLRDCQGHYRGQTAMIGYEPAGETAEPGPTEDGIGVTDGAIAALTGLQLEVLLLDGCESLTDAVADSLAKFRNLRVLDVGNLPATTPAVLRGVTRSLTSLSIDGNRSWPAHGLGVLAEFPAVEELGLVDLEGLTAGVLDAALRGKPLRVLRLGRQQTDMQLRPVVPWGSLEVSSLVSTLRRQTGLRVLSMTWLPEIDAELLEGIARLPALEELDLSGTVHLEAGAVAALGGSPRLRNLRLRWCKGMASDELRQLAGAPLEQLDLYGTQLPVDEARALGLHLSNCSIELPDGRRAPASRPR